MRPAGAVYDAGDLYKSGLFPFFIFSPAGWLCRHLRG
jgi:hypothetical protein